MLPLPLGVSRGAEQLEIRDHEENLITEFDLLEEGLVVRTPRGRALTAKGREVLALTSGP